MAIVRQVAKFDSHEQSERAERAFMRSLSPQERLDLLLTLIAREVGSDEAEQGFARVHRVIELPRR